MKNQLGSRKKKMQLQLFSRAKVVSSIWKCYSNIKGFFRFAENVLSSLVFFQIVSASLSSHLWVFGPLLVMAIYTTFCVHIGDVTEMIITWVTTAENISSVVEYGLADEALDLTISGYATKFVDGGTEKRVMYIHRVKLTDLKPATSYGA